MGIVYINSTYTGSGGSYIYQAVSAGLPLHADGPVDSEQLLHQM